VSSVPEFAYDATEDEGVSPRTAKRLRDAMDRLLAGRPQRTDGRLIKDNLWKEADVSRATMNRAFRILAEWHSATSVLGLTPDGGHLTGGTAGPAGRMSEYTPEFREQAVRLVIETGRPVAHVAAEIGMLRPIRRST
jgi:hypothetical protein